MFGVPPSWSFSILPAQILVVVGSSVYLLHYWWLRSANPDISKPCNIVTGRGLYRVIRHPMYFADLIAYAGLALMWAGPLSLVIWLISAIALVKQAQIEDEFILKRSQQDPQSDLDIQLLTDWRRSTQLIIPWLY